MTNSSSTLPPDLNIAEEALSSDLEREWESLAYEVKSSFFQTPQWVNAWQIAYAPDETVFCLTCRDEEGKLRGLLPLAEMTRGLHRYAPVPLRYLGIAGAGPGSGDHLGPLGHDRAIANALLKAAMEVRPSRSCLFESIGPEDLFVPEEAHVKRTVCPTLDFSEIDEFSDVWSRSLRKNLRRHHRKADELGLDIRWHGPGDVGAPTLQGIGALHIKRQQTLGRSGLFDEKRLTLLATLAEASFRGEDGQWVAVMVDESDTIRAGLIGFQFDGRFYEYKTGWDPELHKAAPGKILKSESMKRAKEAGLRFYDLMRGTEHYKYRMGGEDRVDLTMLIPRGLAGRLLYERERFGEKDEAGSEQD